ncbi:MAG: 2-hydroxyacyl-CoA dehydratase [Oscillospiraceae bacterium]|nr:2-hydroxyacyl-CoA dehydratase [Oscillospiraceae bacterium]
MNKTQKHIIMIPAMLDFHFPLIRLAFEAPEYEIVILENKEQIKETGLRYIHNDLCYPLVLIAGQMISALKSGKYDLSRVWLLIPQAGDACRGSNYIHMLRRAVDNAGFHDIPVMSLNVTGLESKNRFHVRPVMIRKAIAALFYSDLLFALYNQLVPYEADAGSVDKKVHEWRNVLTQQIRSGHGLSAKSIKNTMNMIAEDFRHIKLLDIKLNKIGIAGELYVKYCSLGNNDLCPHLIRKKCEYIVSGLSWYVLYYIDTHLAHENPVVTKAAGLFSAYLVSLQRSVVDILRKNGFVSLDAFDEYKRNAGGLISFTFETADGWLIGADICNYSRCGYKKIIAAQPFECMPNHVCGKGIYRSLQKKLGDVSISSIDYDTSLPQVNIHNRIQMLLDS